ncbi:hypothetical protein OSF85_000540 [Enterococcus faecium]|nr:hypothetical protein [Enterococcus faecium]
MGYLTYEEYEKLGFSKIPDQKTFDELEPYAERQINRLTADFYLKNDLIQDSNEYRVQKFKLAMAIQVEYLFLNGGKTTLQEMLSGTPTSVSIGRMRIEGASVDSATYGRTMVSSEAYAELIYTGLLYRGVNYK